MPIYEYQCDKCGTINEFLLLKESEQDGLTCKECSSADLKKILSAHNAGSSRGGFEAPPGGCCGSPNSCGMPGSCCSGH